MIDNPDAALDEGIARAAQAEPHQLEEIRTDQFAGWEFRTVSTVADRHGFVERTAADLHDGREHPEVGPRSPDASVYSSMGDAGMAARQRCGIAERKMFGCLH